MKYLIPYMEYWSLRAFGVFAAMYAVFGWVPARYIAMVAFDVLVWTMSAKVTHIILEAVSRKRN